MKLSVDDSLKIAPHVPKSVGGIFGGLSREYSTTYQLSFVLGLGMPHGFAATFAFETGDWNLSA
jgi:hypothetical protein